MTDAGFTHLDDAGNARMVNVAGKDQTHRTATAKGKVNMAPDVAKAIAADTVKKGDVLGVARIAGIQAAKRTSELIPLCHGLALSAVTVDFELHDDHVEITANAEATDRTGVEMEALTAVNVAALTVYDMCKALDRSMTITDIALWEKTGGKSGTYRRST